MTGFFSLFPAFLIAGLCLCGLYKGVDVYSTLCRGASKGLDVLRHMLPALVCLFPVIWLFRASSLPDMLSRAFSPLFAFLGIPEETSLIMLLRPLSGSGALAAASDIISIHGADSLVGRTAAVMLGSSETTFYVIAVYLSAAGIRDSRWALWAALAADLACFVSSAWVCRLFWG